MKVFLTFFLLLVSPAFLLAQYSQELESFHKLSVFGNIDLLLRKGDVNRIELPREGSFPEYFRLDLSREKLSLRFVPKPRDWDWDPSVQVIITYKELDELWVHAGAELEADHSIDAEDFKLEGSMGAMVNLEINADRLLTYVTEGAQVRLDGNVRVHRVKVTTGGQYHGYSLEAEEVEAKANTGGVAKVWATKKIEASAHMGGTVRYKGDPGEYKENEGIAGTVRGH